MKTIRVFISSPGDVREERELTQRAIDLLRIELAGKIALDATFWEDVPLSAARSFQPQLPRGSEFDIVICLMWSTLGTPIADLRPDGSAYESGTVFEFENAIAAALRDERKTVLFYHRTSTVTVPLDAPDLEERRTRLQAVNDYISKWFAPAQDGSLPRAFRRYATPQEYGSLVQRHLRRQIGKLVPREGDADPAEVMWSDQPPFRGLRTFEFEHAAIFRGRNAAVAEITAGLVKKAAEGCAFALILGMSGGGKSSVARAGVIPHLVFYETLPAGHAWRRAVACPGDVPGRPLLSLANALTHRDGVPELLTGDQAEDTFASLLQRSPQSAADVLVRTLRSNELRLVLLLDQLEEIFTLGEFDDALRQDLLEFLGTLARSGVVWVLATLRSDYYAHALATPALAALKSAGSWTDLAVPKEAEIAQMIRFPARAAGLRYAQIDGHGLDDVLLEEATQNPRALPLLQFTLEELYAKRTPAGVLTFESYRQMGGLKGSIASKAGSVFDDIDPADRKSLSRVLSIAATVEHEHREIIPRRRFPRAHFASDPEALRLIDAFVEARLFVTGGRTDGERTIEVAHEALFSEWPEAREWFKQNDELIRLHARVAAAARTWQDDGRPADRLAYEGRPLNDVRELLARSDSREVQLDSVELAFARASLARFDAEERARIERDRAERRRLKRAAVAFASLAAVAVVFAGISWMYRETANAERTTAQSTLDLLVGMFEQVSPRVALGRDVTVKEVMRLNEKTIGAQLQGKDEILARVLRAMAEVYTALGDTERSTTLLQKVVAMQDAFGAGADERAATLTSLGYAYAGAFEDDKALEQFGKAVKLAESRDLSASRLTDALAGQAGTYLWIEPAKARALYEKALKIDTEHEGASSYDTRRDEIGIARSWSHERQYEKALPLLEDLRTRTVAAVGGGGHPDVAEISNLMATAYWNKGDIPAAQRHYQHALDVVQMIYEKDDPEVANALNNVARLGLEQCGFEQAAGWLEESLRIQREKIRTPQPLAMFSLTNLALIRMQEGNLAVARDLLSEAGQMLTTAPEESIAFDMRAGEAWVHALSAEIEMSSGKGGDAYIEAALNRAEELLTASQEPEDGWRFAVLRLTQARFLERTAPLDARKIYLEALRKYETRWLQGSLFSKIALDRIKPLYRPSEKVLQEQQIGSMRGCPP